MVLKDLESRFEALRNLGEQLSEASDAFTAELKIVEEKLGTCNLGLEVEYSGRTLYAHEVKQVWNDNEDRVVGTVQEVGLLAYGKLGREGWGFLVKHYTKAEDFNSGKVSYTVDQFTQPPQLLRNASRDLRLAAADLLPDLLDEIDRRGRTKLAAVRRAVGRK
jgi:hypothetical protein